MSSSSDSDSDPDAPPPPPGAECQRRIEAFLAVAGGDADGGEAYAQMLLQRSAWSVEAALDRHFVKQVRRGYISRRWHETRSSGGGRVAQPLQL